jgi:hypothetical protein
MQNREASPVCGKNFLIRNSALIAFPFYSKYTDSHICPQPGTG